nr:PREDICTED: uncharacterized protein LOC105662951 [Megachile rotundata]
MKKIISTSGNGIGHTVSIRVVSRPKCFRHRRYGIYGEDVDLQVAVELPQPWEYFRANQEKEGSRATEQTATDDTGTCQVEEISSYDLLRSTMCDLLCQTRIIKNASSRWAQSPLRFIGPWAKNLNEH